jgi:hypothetical protein
MCGRAAKKTKQKASAAAHLRTSAFVCIREARISRIADI